MFRPSIKIPSIFHQKPITPRFLKKNFWTKKSKPEVIPENPVPTCGESPSKCLDPSYGQPLPQQKKSFLNFCKGEPQLKPLPSNCEEPDCEKRETFWEYLFGRRKKPEKSPRFLKKYVKCREYSRPKIQKLLDPQPKSPAEFPAPRAVITREFIESAGGLVNNSSAALLFDEKSCRNYSEECKKTVEPFKIPYDELRPSKSIKMGFCRYGAAYEDIFQPARENSKNDGVKRIGRITRLSGELPKPPSAVFNDGNVCESGQKVKTSRIERLKILTASDSDKCPVPNFKPFKSSKS